jgi:hypothetical protein
MCSWKKKSSEVLSKAMEKILMGEDEIMEGDGESTYGRR